MNVAVLGGGYAGMAAAVTLSEGGIPVTIYEAAAHLGGRARRVSHNGTALDNGLHVLIGACREMSRLLALVNRDPEHALLRLPLDWHIHGRFRLRVPPLPAPLHLAAGLLTARGPSFGARLAAARFMRELRAQGFRLPEDMSVAQLLAVHRQDEAMARFLWRPLCVSALNTPPEEASAQVFLNVLRDGLDAARDNSDILVARRDLTALFPEPAAEYVRGRGGTILLGHTVATATVHDGVFSVEARGKRLQFTHIVCALPPHRLLPAISDLPQLSTVAAMVARLRYQPIYSVYLQYPESVRLPAPMVGLAGGLAHWVFDREAICGQKGLVAAVISAAGPHQDLTQDELARRIHAELAQHFGPLPAPLWHRVIAEKRATFACTVGVERPERRTALPGFYLAGDYTASEYPATLEGAVRSGVQCARAVLESVQGA
ncbi:MAG: FAD-dependent oxidoreductase [Betaproteobacteria bacterium]|nr:FAD-dependent oxidoreductase [Betaproteobacteria bacterium]